MSRIKIGVFGSCGNRDLFNSHFNPNYKQDFSITFSYVNDSVINAMSPPIKYSEKDLLDLNGNKLEKVPYIFVKRLLDRKVMQDLVKSHIDYLLLDFYLEIVNGVYLLDDNVVYNSLYLQKCKLYSKIEDKKLVKMSTDLDLFMDMFKENFEKFYSQIEKELPNLTLILNPIRESYKVQQNDNSLIINECFKNSKNNYYSALIEKWILNNYDIESLIFKKQYNLSQNHKWGFGPTHYVPEYYKQTSQQIKELTQRIEFLNQHNQHQINNDIRLTRNNYNLLKIDEIITREEDKTREELCKKRYDELYEENQKVKNLLSEVLTSNSWKLTGPLRNIRNKL